ncbi:tigger transposable element-derived protein 4-like [Bombus pyrosoma]|uniref:tigger transposable element-derived protein 4-like n=1 Tax=Bombus pyrosoma TaxID=396416 RepID=UPI001CB8DA77|nr:tigger transposable element-derived protein 4-like [Bombus pyrosoma]
MKAVKEQLFEWACKKYAMNSPLDRRLLREKALELARISGSNGFKCSDRWLTTFLKEYGFSTDLISQPGPMFTDYRDWIDLMRSTIVKYRHKDLFHADELTMYSDVLPSGIPCNGVKDPRAIDSSRNRVTVLMSCNSSGTTKLPLFVCGPYASKITAKEHVYNHSDDSCIGDEFFRSWLSNVNDRMVESNRKILLFLQRGRARALKNFVASNVQLVYFPEDLPAFLRPLRRDVFHYVKMVFRRRYAERLKRYTMKWNVDDILASLIEAWESIPRELIVFSFQRTHFRTDDCFLRINCDCWNSLKVGISFKKFVTFDDGLSSEPATYEKNRRCRCYELSNRKNVKQTDNDTVDSVLKNMPQGISGATVPKLPNESDRNLRATPLNVKNRTCRKYDCFMVRSRVNGNASTATITHNTVKENLVEASSERCKSQNRIYSETQFSTKEWNGNRCASGQGNIKNTFVSKYPNVIRSTSFGDGTFQTEANQTRESLQPIVDKAFALSSISTTESNSTNSLIDNINMTDRETIRNPEHNAIINNLTRFKRLNNEQGDAKSKCTNQGTVRSSILNKFNQPSTSANNCNVTSEMIGQVTPQLLVENRSESQSSSVVTNNESSLPSVRQKILNFTKQKRRNSLSNNSEDDSETSEPREKKLKTNHNWSKQFETSFVFGSPDTDYSLAAQRNKNIVESGIFNISPFISPRD